MRILRLLPLVLLLTGCSVFNKSTQKLTINTHPADADVYLNGRMIGKSPVTQDVKRGEDLHINVQKEGFAPENHLVRYHLSNTGIADIIGSGWLLFPAFGLLSPGAWSYNETDVDIRMYPK